MYVHKYVRFKEKVLFNGAETQKNDCFSSAFCLSFCFVFCCTSLIPEFTAHKTPPPPAPLLLI